MKSTRERREVLNEREGVGSLEMCDAVFPVKRAWRRVKKRGLAIWGNLGQFGLGAPWEINTPKSLVRMGLSDVFLLK